MENLINILGFAVPFLILLGIVGIYYIYLLLKSYIEEQSKIHQLELQSQNQSQDGAALRLQAYERLVLYLERISPQRLIGRLRQEGMTSPELQFAMISTIRAEFEHNITQQLYVSSASWLLIKTVTEEQISIINKIATDLPVDATGSDLGRGLLSYFAQYGLPTENAIQVLKTEASELLGISKF